MIEHILKILKDAPDTFLNNVLYNVLNDSNLRKCIGFNSNCDKFTFPRCLVEQKTDHKLIDEILIKGKIIDGTNIHIMMWADTIYFWLE